MSYVVEPNWIGFSGEPVTGTLPPRLRVMAGTLTPTLLSQVSHRYHLFCSAKRVSLARYHVSDSILPDGSRLRMVSNSDLVDVLVWSATGAPREEGEQSASMAYPVILEMAYMPIFDRYVFDRVNEPPVMPDLPEYPNPPVLTPYPPAPTYRTDTKTLYYYIVNPGLEFDKLILIDGQIPTVPDEYEGSYQDWVGEKLLELGTVLIDQNGGASALLNYTVARADWPYGGFNVMTNGQRWARIVSGREWIPLPGGGFNPAYWYTTSLGTAYRDDLADEIEEHNAEIDAENMAASNAWQAAKSAIDASNQSATDAWQDAYDLVQGQRDTIIATFNTAYSDWDNNPIDIRSEMLERRREGRAAQILAMNARMDGGIADRHITFSVFDPPLMVRSKTEITVDFGGGSAPLDIAGYREAENMFFAEYAMDMANRETPLGTGDGGTLPGEGV